MVTVRFRGDFGKIGEWAKRFSHAAVEQAKRAIAERVAAEALVLVEEGFQKEQAPNGARWAPLKYRVGKILTKTGKLRGSFKSSTAGRQIRITSRVKYAGFHQSGTSRMVARPMLPGGSLPRRWDRRLTREAEQVLLEKFGGGR